jgi:hypothetical protein
MEWNWAALRGGLKGARRVKPKAWQRVLLKGIAKALMKAS